MKHNTLFAGLILSTLLLAATSCEKTDDHSISDIEGTYRGSFSINYSLKSELKDGNGEHEGIAEITMMGSEQIGVHCYGDEIDTIIVLDIYRQNDSVFVCGTEDDFQKEYGHEKGGRHMGHMGESQTQWMHHLEDDHDDGDDHFGNFDMRIGAFSYSFSMMDNLNTYYLNFYGIRE